MSYAHLQQLLAADTGAPVQATMVVEDGVPFDVMWGAIEAWFGDDDTHTSLRILLNGRSGLLSQDSAFQLVEPQSKGLQFGSSDDAALPGRGAYAAFPARCAVADCPASPVLLFMWDAAAPPSCTVHPAMLLELV